MKTFLSAEWRNLLMANYQIDPAILKNYLPTKTELATWNGTCYISLVGFMFCNTKVLGVGIPHHQNFEEVNLRFYVRYKDGNKWVNGVVFIKEIVPRVAITFIANTVYKENYITLPMRHLWDSGAKDLRVSYSWKFRTEWHKIEATADRQETLIQDGSEEEFITEHFRGYTRLNADTSAEYEVLHPRWTIHKVNSFENNAAMFYGQIFEDALNQKPKSVFLATGSKVQVGWGRKI